MEKISARYSYWILILFFTFGLILNQSYQKRIFKDGGKGHDGVYYYELADNMTQGNELIGLKPYIYRLGTPFLVSLLPFDIFTNFLIVNHTATLLGCLLLMYWLSLFFKKRTTALLITLGLMTHWGFYVRFIQYNPTTCDPIAFLITMLLLLLIKRFYDTKKSSYALLSCLFIFTGVFFREYLLVYSFLFLFTNQPFDRTKAFYIDWSLLLKHKYWFLLAFSCGIFGILLTHIAVNPIPSDYGFIAALILWTDNKSIFSLATGFLNVFGPFVLFPFLYWKQTKEFFDNHHQYIALLLIAIGIIWFTGGDTERFILWFFPILILPIGLVIEKNLNFKNNLTVWIPILISMVFIYRLFWPIPYIKPEIAMVKFPVFHAFHEDAINLLSFHGMQKVRYLILIEYGVLCAYVLIVMRLKITKDKVI